MRRFLTLFALGALSCTAASSTPTRAPAAAHMSLLLEAPASDKAPAEAEAVAADGDRGGDSAERAPTAVEEEQGLDVELMSDVELADRVANDLPSLGSMSLGRTNAGALVNGVKMPQGDQWHIEVPHGAYGTEETVGYLMAAIGKVNDEFPGAHKLFIGHLSRQNGGPMRPHRSHQAGRDVDISYYYVPEKAEWYRPATKRTLDVERSWSLVRALLTETDVELLIIDRKVQKLLKEHALAIGEDRDWLDTIFQYRSRHPAPIIRHRWGHRTHIHVRFYNPRAQLLGVRAYRALVDNEIITPRYRLVRYRVKGGDSLATLAQKAGTSSATIQKVNGLGGGKLNAGQTYYVPVRGQVVKVASVDVPARRLPPTASDSNGSSATAQAGPKLSRQQ